MSNKTRLDLLLTERGLQESRQKAQATIMSGLVFVNGQRVDKPGTAVPNDAPIEIRGNTLKYVSRGGLKLEKAMAEFPIDLHGCICGDIGASTGGFTDCMLQNGASKVYAVDVGYGQLAWKLREDPRVICMERTNARYLSHEQISDELDFASIDVSFISLKLILPAVAGILKDGGCVASLVKPQFEAGREKVGKKGVVRDPTVHKEVLEHYLEHAQEAGFGVLGLTYSPIRGPEGNIEYLGFLKKGAELDKVRKTIIINGALNSKIPGKSAYEIAKMAGVDVPENTKILIGEVESVDISEEFAHEKLSPVLAMYKAKTFDEAIAKAEQLVADGGYGHTSALYIDTREKEKMEKHAAAMKTCRILINTPSSQGGIGDLYNFKLVPSLTLGCGSWGGNSVSENVGVKHLINIKTVAERRENMLWIRTPEKVYFKKGCLPVALDELGTVMHKKRCFIVTDSFLYKNGYTKKIEDKLDQMGIVHTCFYDVEPDPSLASARAGAAAMRMFEPDCIIAMGGGSAMDAGKIMWVLYENPDANFDDMAMDFMDIRKRIFTFPHMGKKAYFIAVPTSSGTGSEVTPFAIITDKTTGIKWPLADYELMPDMAIVDTDNMMSAPKGLTCASGIDVMTHALEAYASMMASDYTDGLALNAIKLVFNYLPRAYKDGSDVEARQHMANASCMAGMAFANAFLGVNHSLAHKLGAFHHLPHGIANALVLLHVLRYNAAEVPAKMGTFPQYQYPHTLARYAEIGRSVGLTGKNDSEVFEKLLQKLQELMDTIEIKHTIKEYGVDEKYFLETLDEMTEQAFNDQCTGANPRYPLMSELKEIYLKAYYGEGNIPESGKAKEKKEAK